MKYGYVASFHDHLVFEYILWKLVDDIGIYSGEFPFVIEYRATKISFLWIKFLQSKSSIELFLRKWLDNDDEDDDIRWWEGGKNDISFCISERIGYFENTTLSTCYQSGVHQFRDYR